MILNKRIPVYCIQLFYLLKKIVTKCKEKQDTDIHTDSDIFINLKQVPVKNVML